MRKLFILLSIFSLCMLSACNANMPEGTPTSTPLQSTQDSNTTNKVLVVYFSATGNTKAVAEKITTLKNANLFEILPLDLYTDDNLNYNNPQSRTSREQNDPEAVVELVSTDVDGWDDYEVIFLGYPIWFGQAAKPVYTFVANNDFNNKTVIPFCTSGGSGIGTSDQNLAALSNGGMAGGDAFFKQRIRFRDSIVA